MKTGKQVRRIVLLTALAALLVGAGLGAAASGAVTRTIEATYMNIKLVVDGTEVTPKDAAGNVVEPFASGGTTYLPVRAVANALGKEVTWDGNTNTVYIGNTARLPYQVNEAVLYDGSDSTKTFSVAGQTHALGVVIKSYHTTHDIRERYDGVDGSAVWNTQGFQTMTFTVGHVGDRQENATLYVALDGRAAGEYPLKWDGSPQTISVPLGGSGNVKLTLISEKTADSSGNPFQLEGMKTAFAVYDVKLR